MNTVADYLDLDTPWKADAALDTAIPPPATRYAGIAVDPVAVGVDLAQLVGAPG
ncbi:MAG: hypothetical protein AABO58_22890 [Acidobacteriota bacterium]